MVSRETLSQKLKKSAVKIIDNIFDRQIKNYLKHQKIKREASRKRDRSSD